MLVSCAGKAATSEQCCTQRPQKYKGLGKHSQPLGCGKDKNQHELSISHGEEGREGPLSLRVSAKQRDWCTFVGKDRCPFCASDSLCHGRWISSLRKRPSLH